LPFSAHIQALFDRLHPLQCSTSKRHFGVATLKDVFENVASRNIIAYVYIDIFISAFTVVYNVVFTLA